VVAFEAAKRREAMGDEVTFVGRIDIPPHLADHMYETNWIIDMLNSSYFLDLVCDYGANGRASALTAFARKEQLEVVWKLSLPEHLVELQLTPDKLDYWVDVAGLQRM
ncbi:hypothetical protein EDB19DRAFT_1614779, partial [Suillus lakei]